MPLKLNDGYLKSFISDHEYESIAPQLQAAHELLTSGKGPGGDFTGWVTLPTDYDKEEFQRIKAAARRVKENSDVFRLPPPAFRATPRRWWSSASAAPIWAPGPPLSF